MKTRYFIPVVMMLAAPSVGYTQDQGLIDQVADVKKPGATNKMVVPAKRMKPAAPVVTNPALVDPRPSRQVTTNPSSLTQTGGSGQTQAINQSPR